METLLINKVESMNKNFTISFVWGILSATLLVIAPEVYLTYLAMHSLKSAYKSVFFALAGTVLGTLLFYLWGFLDFSSLKPTLEFLPGISSSMMQTTIQSMKNEETLAILKCAFTFTPFHLVTAIAGGLKQDLGWFLLIYIPARLLSMLVLPLVTIPLKKLHPKNKLGLHLTIWTIVYVIYFSLA